MKKIILGILISISAAAATTVVAEKLAVDCNYVGYTIINNMYNNIDYKIPFDKLSTVEENLQLKGTVERLSEVGSQNLADLSKEESWLILNNIIARPYSVADGNCIIYNYKANDYCPKTLLYTMLYKSYYGVLDSRAVTLYTKSYRNGAYVDTIPAYAETEDNIINATFADGDCNVLMSANVYELYLKQWIDKGFINKKELTAQDGKAFLADYNKLSTNVASVANVSWDSTLAETSAENALGYSNSYGVDSTGTMLTIDEDTPYYFGEENILTLDALKIIADIMRSCEKDMSALESSIVSYKYGVKYLNVTDPEDKKDIEYLIAKGVLDFEHPEEFINLYSKFTYETALKILYRVANKSARLDFSEVTITDQESFWMEKGFHSNDIAVRTGTALPNVETITEEYWELLIESDRKAEKQQSTTEEQEESTPTMFIDDILGFVKDKSQVAYAANNTSLFTVTKMFDMSYDYLYDGTPIDELSTSDIPPEEFVSFETYSFTGAGSRSATTMAKVVFSVEARDYETAVLFVDNNISISGGINCNDVKGYTTITENGEEITLISQTSLKASISNITVIEDKVLMNNVTGQEALILGEDGYALVGNRVVISDTLMITDTSDEIYYNLDVICALLSNTYLSKLTNNTLYVCASIENEKAYKVKSSTNNTIAQAYAVTLNLPSTSGALTGTRSSSNIFFNIDNFSKGTNVLTRKFPIYVSSELENVYVIVQWEYVVPDMATLSTMLDNDFANPDGLTLNDVNNALYTEPEDPVLLEWWKSNKSISNSLANFMYGTSGVEYVKSGYMAPSVTVLRPSSVTDGAVSTIFTSYGFKLDTDGLAYCGTTTNWWEQYFAATNLNEPYAKALALQNRHFTLLNASSATDGAMYGSDYFVTKAGVIYQNVDANNLVNFVENGRTKYFKLQTREASCNAQIAEGTLFTYEGRTWIYRYVANRESGHAYYVVQPYFTVDDYYHVTVVNTSQYGVLPCTTGIVPNNESSLYNDAVTRLNEMYQTYFPGVTPFSTYSGSNEMFGASGYTVNAYYDSLYADGDYYVSGNILVNGDSQFVIVPSNSTQSVVVNNGVTNYINCVPLFYLPVGNFYFFENEGQFYMGEGALASALSMNNVFTTGISRAVIDSIINRHIKTVPVNSLISGQRLLINDVFFTRTTDSHGNTIFLSDPISNNGLLIGLKNGSEDTAVDVIKRQLFAANMVQYNGVSYYLSSFVKSGGLGNISNPEDNLGILYKTNGAMYVYVDGTNTAQDPNTTNATAVCIAIQLSDGLLCRPTNEKQNTYVLLYTSSMASDSTVDDIPFGSESLSYEDASSDYVAVSVSKFSPSSLFKTTKKNFKIMMQKAFAGDVRTIIWMFVFYFSVYLSIMSWIMYFILTKGYARRFFETLTIPVGSGGYIRRGFDIVKIVTFGIFNIDAEPTLARTFVSSFICFFISYAIVFWHPF